MEKSYRTLVDPNTGECYDVVKFTTAQQQKFLDNANEIKNDATRKFMEQFVWVIFQYGEKLFPNVATVNINRLIYLATYCHEDSSLMLKSEMQNVLQLTQRQWYAFWNDMKNNDILYTVNDMVYINNKMFAKGKIHLDNDIKRTRLFCNCVRTLYESCNNSGGHKQLSYIYKIIPFVNRRTNIISYNPEEQDLTKIRYMTLGDFCDNIGYDRSQAQRLLSDLLAIRINGEKVIMFIGDNLDKTTWYLIVNPKIYYGGKNDEILQDKINLFQLKTQQND